MPTKPPSINPSFYSEEFWQQIYEKLNSIANIYSNLDFDYSAMYDRLSAAARMVQSDSISKLMSQLNKPVVQNIIVDYYSMQSRFEEAQSKLSRAIALARPYMTNDQIENAESILPDVFDPDPPEDRPSRPARQISLNSLLALLSLLFTIIFGIIATLPDEQLELISEQNTEIIEQNEELIRQQDEQLLVLQDLLKAAEDASDLIETIEDNSDDLAMSEDVPAELSDDSNQTAESEDEPEDNDTLNQAQNAED